MTEMMIHDKDKKEKRLSSCQKAHSGERAKYVKSMLMLKQQEYSLERNLANLMENMKLDPEVLRPVLHNMGDISKNRQIFLDGITRSLEEIAEELRLVKSIEDSPETIQRLDTNVYKRRLVKLSQKIRKVEESCQLQTLLQEQTILESELREFQKNLHKYESGIGSAGKSLSVASFTAKENKKCQDYKEIQDFHALIAKTGHTENWSDEDHLLFVRLRKKCSNIPALVAAIQAKCPDLTAEIIVNHEAWYKIYLNLREKQRLAVREWRKQKEMEKLKNHEDETDVEDLIQTSTKKSSNFAKKLPTHVSDKCETKISKTGDTVDNANQKKILINRWKAEREKKRLMDEEQSKNLITAKLAAQEKRKKERYKKIQESLAKYREKKSMTSSETAKAAPRYNAKLIKAFREQDEEYTNRRKVLIAKILKPTKTRTTQVVGSQIARRRKNHSTLLNSTKVWREKCRTQDLSTREPKKLQYIKDIPRLWRNKQESTEIKNVLTFS